MPQASDELRAAMRTLFGDEIDDSGPLTFLLSHGFTDEGGMLFKPTKAHNMSIYERLCVTFLCEEWDYGFGEYFAFAVDEPLRKCII